MKFIIESLILSSPIRLFNLVNGFINLTTVFGLKVYSSLFILYIFLNHIHILYF